MSSNSNEDSAIFITIKYKAVHGRHIAHNEDLLRSMSCCSVSLASASLCVVVMIIGEVRPQLILYTLYMTLFSMCNVFDSYKLQFEKGLWLFTLHITQHYSP